MSVNSIYTSSYASISTLFQGLTSGSTSTDTAATQQAQHSTTVTSSSASKLSSLYAGNSGTAQGLAAAVKAAMDDMNLSSTDKISFQTLMEYRDQLMSGFTEQVRTDLREAGVNEDVEFRLVSTQDGTGVQVLCDNADDKTIIEQYFTDNPDMVEQFEKLQGLSKMEETRKSQRIDVKSIQSRIQLESMTTWFSSSSPLMAFSSMGVACYSGINTFA